MAELGHMVVRSDGRQCYCWSRGCWETEVGESALCRALGLTVGSPRGAVIDELRALSAEAGDAGEPTFRHGVAPISLLLCGAVTRHRPWHTALQCRYVLWKQRLLPAQMPLRKNIGGHGRPARVLCAEPQKDMLRLPTYQGRYPLIPL